MSSGSPSKHKMKPKCSTSLICCIPWQFFLSPYLFTSQSHTFPPTIFTRTSGHSVGTFRVVNFLLHYTHCLVLSLFFCISLLFLFESTMCKLQFHALVPWFSHVVLNPSALDFQKSKSVSLLDL
jgi:hypothetical protein